jgi:hypothetical protein
MDVSSDSIHNFFTNGIVWLSHEYSMHIHETDTGFMMPLVEKCVGGVAEYIHCDLDGIYQAADLIEKFALFKKTHSCRLQ